MQYITRKGNFDSAHRVMNEKMKCFNLHGHTYLYELTFAFESAAKIGYAIDFKEIKRVACQWIDDYLDHGTIVNPEDTILIDAAIDLGSKIWHMSLNGMGKYCNPTVENIAKEVFLAIGILFEEGYKGTGLVIHNVKIFETPNCWTDCNAESITNEEAHNFNKSNGSDLVCYAQDKGIVNYDDRAE